MSAAALSALVAEPPRPRVVMKRMGGSAVCPATTSNAPTANATRYVGIGAVVANVNAVLSPSGTRDVSDPFETASIPVGTVSATSYGVFHPGSSKRGNARRASAASNCVNA